MDDSAMTPPPPPPDFWVDQRPLTPDQRRSRARTRWSSGLESKLALIASLMLPMDCFLLPLYLYDHGGGAMFLPFFLFFVAVLGVPLLLLNVAVGQFTGRGVWSAWNITPLFKGIGYLVTMMNSSTALIWFWFLVANILFCADLAMSPPEEVSIVSHCPNRTAWNKEFFDVFFDYNFPVENRPKRCTPSNLFNERWVHPSFDYLTARDAVHESESFTIDPAAVLTMMLVVLLVCGIVAAGRRAIGLLSAASALLTPLLLWMLVIRMLMLPGAVEYGLTVGFSPTGHTFRFRTIIDAALLALYTVNACFGQTLTVASYNRFNNCFLIDALLAIGIHLFTIIVSALLCFGAHGVLAAQDYEYPEVGLGLEATAKITEVLLLHCPSGGFWTTCFLVCILLRGLVASVWVVETVVVAVWDLLPHTNRFRLLLKKHVLVAVFAVPWLFYSIGYCVKGAWIMATWHVTWMTGPLSMTLICLLECAAVAWMFGSRRFQDCWSTMQGSRCCCPYPLVFWAIVAPILLLALLIYSLVTVSIPYDLVDLASFIFAILVMVISALVLLFTRPGTLRQKWKIMTTPWDLAPHQMQYNYGRYETIPMATMAN